MNDQIKQLRLQARKYACNFSSIDDAFEEKFAELIVRECIQQLRYKSAQLVDVDYFPEYKEQLEKHFGVTE